jgi:DNA-binding NarL/FixJ family response regulator
VRVALADDAVIVRTGLVRLLEDAGMEVVHAARDGAELLAAVARHRPAAVVVDVRMPPDFHEEGLEVAERIKSMYPGVGVLVLSTYGETAYAVRLMSIPVPGVGYLLKDRVDDVDVLVRALERVAGGQAEVDPEIVARLFHSKSPQSGLSILSDREREVLQHMAEGRSNAGIALTMCLSPRTVETYATRVFDKLAIRDDGVDHRRVLAVLAWLRNNGPLDGLRS